MNRDKLIIVLGAALFLSLAGNLFMGGVMLGRSYAPHEQSEQEARHAEWKKRDEELRRQLSPQDRKILKAAMQQRRPQFQALREALQQAQQKVEAAQNAQPFDQQALDAALRDEAEKKSRLVQMMHEAKREIAQQLSPEGREVFTRVMQARMNGAGQNWRRPGGMRPGDGPRGFGGGNPQQGRPPGPQPQPQPGPDNGLPPGPGDNSPPGPADGNPPPPVPDTAPQNPQNP